MIVGGSVCAAAADAAVHVVIVDVASIVVVVTAAIVQRYRSTLVLHAATLQAHNQREEILIRDGGTAVGVTSHPSLTTSLRIHRNVRRWQFRALLLNARTLQAKRNPINITNIQIIKSKLTWHRISMSRKASSGGVPTTTPPSWAG